MHPRPLVTSFLALPLVALAARLAFGQHGGEKAEKPAAVKQAAGDMSKQAGDAARNAAEQAAKDLMAKLSPEEQKMMDAMMKAGTPGEHHRHMAELEGKWNAVVKSRWGPDKPWEESKGEMDYKVVMGGRYLHMFFKGEMGGVPFDGAGTMAYDNTMKKYVSTWMDSMSTACMVAYGECDPSHKIITSQYEMADPTQDGKMVKSRTVMTIVDKDKHTYQMYCPTPDGKGEYICLEIHYTRAK